METPYGKVAVMQAILGQRVQGGRGQVLRLCIVQECKLIADGLDLSCECVGCDEDRAQPQHVANIHTCE